MNDHSHYEELTALAAGGHLSDQEFDELHDHLAHCAECRSSEREFSELLGSALPLARSDFFYFVDKMKARPEAGARKRFLERARHEGIRFSPNVEKPTLLPRRLGFLTPLAGALAIAILAVAAYETYTSRQMVSLERAQAQQQVSRLGGELSSLNARLANREETVAAQQREIQDLRAQVGQVATSAEGYRRATEKSSSQNVQLLDELENREKRLAEAKNEIARINQLHATDQASLVAQQVRINEISDQLRIASATIDMERQLAAAGRDIRELMASRQLHVIDVRDTEPNGKPSRAFGRVFLTEGKSLVFYAFDLDEAKLANAKYRLQVWGEQEGQKNSVRSLGFFYSDDKAQRRWAIKVDNPELLNEINSIFVTVAPAGGADKPGKQRLLYTYLGQPNHA